MRLATRWRCRARSAGSAPIRPTSPLPAPAALKPQVSPAPAQPVGPSQPRPPSPSPTTAPPPAGPAPATVPTTPRAPGARELPAAPPGQSAVTREPLVVPLASLLSVWPEPIRQAVSAQAAAALPAEEIEQALKRGRISFPWKRIRSFIKPALAPTTAAELDEAQIELPLPVIAPLFLAQRKPPGSQKKYTMTEEIPDIFHGKALAPTPEAAPVAAAPAAPMVATPAAPMPRAPALEPRPVARVPEPEPEAPPEEIGEVFGQPGRKNWTPMEMVQRTSALKGVAGALIAMERQKARGMMLLRAARDHRAQLFAITPRRR